MEKHTVYHCIWRCSEIPTFWRDVKQWFYNIFNIQVPLILKWFILCLHSDKFGIKKNQQIFIDLGKLLWNSIIALSQCMSQINKTIQPCRKPFKHLMTIMLYLMSLFHYLESSNIMKTLPTLYKAIQHFVNDIWNYTFKPPGKYFDDFFVYI